MFARCWKRYCELLVEKPLITKAATSGTLFGLGDVIGQGLDGTMQQGYDVKRSLRGFFWSAACFTPIAHVWYNRVLEKTIPAVTPKAVLAKVGLDQLLFAPIINGTYLCYAAIAAGGSKQDVKTSLEKNYLNVMKANYMLWPAVQLVNFRFVPPPLQIPVLNVTVLGWSAYLAVTSSNTKRAEASSTDSKEQV